MGLLKERFGLSPDMKVLDIGGEVSRDVPQIIELHPRRTNLTVVNIDERQLVRIREAHPEVCVRVADARRLPFGDQSFDLVFSNAVIEHVGNLSDQELMAREVMRVGQSWFITTPNRWYPYEFHTRLPFIGWLPCGMMRTCAKLWSYNHVAGRYQYGLTTSTRLMTKRELQMLFPAGEVIAIRVTFWPETLVCIGSKS